MEYTTFGEKMYPSNLSLSLFTWASVDVSPMLRSNDIPTIFYILKRMVIS